MALVRNEWVVVNFVQTSSKSSKSTFFLLIATKTSKEGNNYLILSLGLLYFSGSPLGCLQQVVVYIGLVMLAQVAICY